MEKEIKEKIEELEKQKLAIEAQFHQIMGALTALKELGEKIGTVKTK
jgi:hypothetical protein